MRRERLRLALEQIKPQQWYLFEEFASQFLASQYPNLRTVASPSGDRGRDAELFSSPGGNKVLFQYSISKKWEKKITETAKKISANFPDARILIYVTNQSILSASDDLKGSILERFGIALDIFDMTWFLDRLDSSTDRQATAERLAANIVDPFLSSSGVLAHSAPALTTIEYQAALTFLQLQWEDDTRNKGLTKLSFDALVRTVLRDTSSAHRIQRNEIYRRIMGLLPNHDTGRLKRLADSALIRLTKRYVRHYEVSDEFCLTHEETLRVRDRLAEIEVANSQLDEKIFETIKETPIAKKEHKVTCDIVRLAINKFLLQRAELFASAISNNRVVKLRFEELKTAIDEAIDSTVSGLQAAKKDELRNEVFFSMREILSNSSKAIQSHLKSKADAYTILAFLGQTPDVQSAVAKMFSHGEIWLDTTIVLPLFAEMLIENGNQRYTQMIRASAASGLKVKITPGVIEEVERHMNQCLVFARSGDKQWSGRVPFLAEAYLRSGRPIAAFASWIESFKGEARPEDDIAEYLREFFAVNRESLESYLEEAPRELKHVVEATWRQAHDQRRGREGHELDEITLLRLVGHDVENYIGVVVRRRSEKVSPLGYSSWWLSLDRVASRVDRRLREELGKDAPATPVMSADFLVNYLSLGPNRDRVGSEREASLPILLDIDMYGEAPRDLLEEAERVRREADGLEEHVIRRRVRDRLEAAKIRRGRITEEGVEAVLNEIGV